MGDQGASAFSPTSRCAVPRYFRLEHAWPCIRIAHGFNLSTVNVQYMCLGGLVSSISCLYAGSAEAARPESITSVGRPRTVVHGLHDTCDHCLPQRPPPRLQVVDSVR